MSGQQQHLGITASGVVTTDDPINHPIPTAVEATDPKEDQ